MIKFNKPYYSGKEEEYIKDAILNKRKTSGNGYYTKQCQSFFEKKYGFKKCLLTTSCTDALEMASLLIDLKEGDEVIIPSYTFVSSANAFALRGAKIIFCDSEANNPNIDALKIEALITKNTKAIVVVHYAGVACDIDKIMKIADKHNIYVIEDAAQAIDSYYKDKPLGGIGHIGTFSFHETKNIISGEGGMLVINDDKFIKRAEIIWEKGTNRTAFFRGEVDKYNWVDLGSSYLPSDMLAAFLWAQLENLEQIQNQRISIWNNYYKGLQSLGNRLPNIPDYASNNAHMFYLVCNSTTERIELINHLKLKNIHPVFHYQSLHKSPFYTKDNNIPNLPNCDKYSDCLLRLPFYYELTEEDQKLVINSILEFFEQKA